jgi:DNA-binding IclR family transcriptional regulator
LQLKILDEGGPPGWDDLKDAKRAIMKALKGTADRLQNKAIAENTGYKRGSLRHHYGELQRWGYISKTHEGYALTPAGAELILCKPV